MRRILVACMTALLFAALAGSSASAAKPDRQPSADFEFQSGAGEVCAFAIQGTTLVNRGYTTSFFDSDGNLVKQIVSGTLIEEIINLDSGESVVRNISGPGTFLFAPDGTVTLQANGTWLLVTLPGGPSLAYINTGREVIEFAPDGTVTVLAQVGVQEDLCATLS